MGPTYNYRRCPYCGSLETYWRHGLHFNHERRCQQCQRSYDPVEEAARLRVAVGNTEDVTRSVKVQED